MKHIYTVLLLIATLGIGQAWGGTEEITWTGTSLTGASSTNITAGTATAVNGDTYSAGTISISSSKIQTESKKHTADSYWEDFSASAQQVEGGVSATGTARIELPFTVGAGYNFTITDIGYKFEQGGGGGPAVHAFVVQGSTATWLNYTTASTISLTGKSIMLSAGNAKLVFVLGVASNLNNGRQFKFSNISIKGSVEAAASCPTVTANRGGQENGTYTVGNYTGNALTCTASGGTGFTYQWKQYKQTDPNGANDTINAVGTGATTTSFTPNPAEAGIYFYMCRVINSCGNKAVTSTTGAFTFNAAAACTAPSSVDVTGTWKYFPGQDISLTATPTGHTGTPTYQWYHRGTAINGATSATYTKTNCTAADAGNYTCKVSTGTGCATTSANFAVRVYTVEVWKDQGNTNVGSFNPAFTSGTSGTASVALNAGITYEFKISDNCGGSLPDSTIWYGNGGYILNDISTWGFGTPANNCKLFAGPQGNYTVTLDIAHVGDQSPYVNVSVAYPSVTHPVAGYMYVTKWWDCYAHLWQGTDNALTTWGSDPQITTYTTICGTDYWYLPVSDYYTNVIVKDNAGNPSNTSGDQSTTNHSGQYLTHDGSWGWHEFTTYTITFAGNGNTSGSMTDVTGIACGTNRTLAANAYVKTDYIFNGWTANVDVTVGGSTITAGQTIADGAAIQNITSNITLTAQWTACTGPNVTAALGTSGVTDGTHTVGDALGTLTCTAAARNGGALTYLWKQYDDATGKASAVNAAGTNNTATYSIPNNAECTARHYFCVVTEAGCSVANETNASGALTLAAAATLTALQCNTLYKVGDMVPSSITLSTTGQYASGLSTNTKFEVIGDASQTNNAGGTPEMKNEGATTISNESFEGRMYLKGASNTTGSGTTLVPTSRAIKFIIPSSGTLDIYAHRVDRLQLKKEGDSGTTQLGTSTSGTGSMVSHNVTAGTYYIYATNSSTCLYGMRLNCCTTPDAPTSPTNGATTSESQAVSWTDAGNDKWEVYVSTSSSTPAADQTPTASPTSTSYTFEGLTASTTYYWWVRSVCDASHKSNWVAGTSFTTSAAELEALVTWTMITTTDQAWGTSATSTTDGTNISSIGTSHDEGDNAAKNSATAKTAMADAEVTTTAEPTKSARFTFTIASGKKVEPEKVTCKVFNVGSGSRTYKAQISDSNGHVYNSTNTLAVSAEATLTSATFNFASDLVLTGDVTIKVYAWGSGSDFRMGADVKLFGEVDSYSCTALNLTRGGQENGTFTVGSYNGNALTCTVNAGEPASYQWKQYTLGQGVGDAVNAVGSGSTTNSFTPNPASANTYYYACQVTDICGNSATTPYTGTFVFNAPEQYDVTFSLTNVVYSSGANQGTDAATEGVAFSTVFAASSGYDLPSTITVTIGGSPATVSTDYTWNSSSGALEILAASVTGDIVVTIVGPEHVTSDCVTITNFATSNTSCSNNIPDNNSKYFYGYKGTVDAAHAVTITSNDGNDRGQNSGAEMRLTYNKKARIYANNTIDAAPAGFENVVSVSFKWKFIASGNSGSTELTSSYTVKVGSTTIANAVSITGKTNDGYATVTIDNLAQLNGYIEFLFGGSSSSYNVYLDDIEICTADMSACTTPVIPSLSNQALCEGDNAAAWNATQTAVLADGETVSYQWQLKNGSNWDNISGATSASYDVSDAVTEAMAGTYRVVVTVSKAGYSSSSATREVTLSVTEATEVTGITADKATVYAGNSVTLTATANTSVTWQWYTCTNAEGAGESSISGAENAAYTIASAPAAGTYYYKAKGTSSCGTAEYVYTLTVSAASECENYFWFVYADDATANGVINNRDGFFSNTSTGTGNTGTYTMTVDGVSMTGTKRLSTAAYAPKFTVPAGATATLYIYGKAASSDAGKHLVLKRTSDDAEVEVTNNTTVQAYTKENIEAGEWTLSCGSSNWCYSFFAVKVCSTSSCTDATPTISATNTTVCTGSAIEITSTGAEAGATFVWQKLSGSTWVTITDSTRSALRYASATAENAGSYRLIAHKECNRTSNTVTIAVPSAPVFGTVPSSVSVMQTLALSINTVEASDATSYNWYKSADDSFSASGDTEIGSAKNLLKAYDGEAVASPAYYLFCVASNSCGSTTSSAIAVNVIAYIEEDCAIVGSGGEHNTFAKTGSVSSGTYGSVTELHTNSNGKYIYYVAEEGYYFATAKVNACVSNASDLPTAAYSYSTDGGTNWTDVALSGMTTNYSDHSITLPASVNAFRVGRKLGDYGSGSGYIYIHQVCFTYTESCTSTTVTPSTSSVNYEMGGTFTNPTFTVKHGNTAFDPQPTLTYSSSDEDIATVDDYGTVDFTDLAGTVTITASYAGGEISSTQYCASEGSYTITVSCSGGAPKVVAASGTNLSGCNASITLNAKDQNNSDFANGTYQWYRDGEEISGATSASYTVARTGVYTVARTSTGGCTSMSTNSATVTSEAVEPDVERLVPFQYYHVDKTYSNQMKMRHLFAVKNSGTKDGKSFDMTLSRNGGAASNVTSSNSFSIIQNADHTVDTVMIDLNKLASKYSQGDELVLTCSAIDCEGAVSSTIKETITIYVIDQTPTLALICSGHDGDGTRTTSKLTVGGDFLTGYNKADLCQQTGKTSFDKNTEWGLYTELKEEYIVTPVNGYAEFNKLNYEPFDILFLTDYPKASKSDAAATILDDMADLVDYRPLFSFKTHMVAKSPSKWAAKGFTTAPEVPKQTRTRLNIVCYAHPMFATLKDKSGTIQEDASDHTQIVYTMLSGAGYESSKGMQGFHIEAAENFVTIGLVHYNATAADETPEHGYVTWTPGSGDQMLVAAAERQTNIEARMVLFSLNAGAHSKLTETGEQVVLKCLEYLLDTDPIHVADCSFTFDNGEGNSDDYETYRSKCPTCTGTKGDHKWSTAANWGPDYIILPGASTSVKIAASVEVDIPDAKAMNVNIVDGGHITIPASTALEVTGTVRHADGSEISATDNSEITICSNATGNGTLIFNNDNGDTKATVQMYTSAQADMENWSAATSTWQYVGTPHNDVASATWNYLGAWLYQYDTSTEGWVVIPNGGPLEPFRGYCVTHETSPHTFNMKGTLAATTSQNIAIPAGKYVVVANSWVAPIDINAIMDDDMEGITDKSIYFFNTGTDTIGDGTLNPGDRWAAGTYVSVPIHAAPYTGDDHIPSMQGFYVVGGSTDGTLHLDYDRHVRGQSRGSIVSGRMHAPRRVNAAEGEPTVLKMYARGSRYDDRLIVLEREDFTRRYDSGWDGEAWGGSELSPMVYITNDDRVDESVSAIPEYEGTVVTFRAGEDDEYDFDFVYSPEAPLLYLLDLDNNTYTRVVTGNRYHFSTSDKDAHQRFIFTRTSSQPSHPTSIDETNGDSTHRSGAIKFIKDGTMYILVNGVLYDATGKTVRQKLTDYREALK